MPIDKAIGERLFEAFLEVYKTAMKHVSKFLTEPPIPFPDIAPSAHVPRGRPVMMKMSYEKPAIKG
jgi:hypothetical protein